MPSSVPAVFVAATAATRSDCTHKSQQNRSRGRTKKKLKKNKKIKKILNYSQSTLHVQCARSLLFSLRHCRGNHTYSGHGTRCAAKRTTVEPIRHRHDNKLCCIGVLFALLLPFPHPQIKRLKYSYILGFRDRLLYCGLL